MKTKFLSVRSLFTLAMLLLFFSVENLWSQETHRNLYFEITNLKSQGDDFLKVQDEIVRPFVQERIRQGNMLGWYLFEVLYPDRENAPYDYVALAVFDNFNDLHISTDKTMAIAAGVFPGADLEPLVKRYDESAEQVSSQVFMHIDEAVPGPPDKNALPAIVRVNHMKVNDADRGAYVQMEREVFKPMHQAAAKAGAMNDWMLFERILPFGTEWDNTYLTFDLFNTWADMGKPGPDNLFETVHPGKSSEATWKKMAGLRELRRSEIWEGKMAVMGPIQEVSYKTVRPGEGTNPGIGDEVAYRIKLMNAAGDVMASSHELGFEFYHIIGEDPYMHLFDKSVMKMKKGGLMEMTVPPDQQDAGLSNMFAGKPGTIKIELVDFGDPAPDGAALLKKKISDHGLDVAKAKFEKLQTDNPNGYVFREGPMNSLGYELLADDNVEAAIYILTMNTKLYPESWNVYDSLADAYMEDGNRDMARKNYQMAVKINPDFKSAKDKLAGM